MPRRKRILCVEDHLETGEFIQVLLSEYEIVRAETLAEGMRRATGGRFDLYLLDYHLQDGTGLELCSHIRAFNRKTPILIYSGANFISEQEALAAGAWGFIEKKGSQFIDRLEGEIHRLLKAH